MIGVLFAAVLLNVEKYDALLPLLAILSIVEGGILLSSGIWLQLPPFPFLGDSLFCLGVGAGLLLVYSKAKQEQNRDP